MYSTIYFIQFLAIILWYRTSTKVKHPDYSIYLLRLNKAKQVLIFGSISLSILSATLLIVQLGCMSGICSFITGIMCLCSLVVVLKPMKIINYKIALTIYLLSILFEHYL